MTAVIIIAVVIVFWLFGCAALICFFMGAHDPNEDHRP